MGGGGSGSNIDLLVESRSFTHNLVLVFGVRALTDLAVGGSSVDALLSGNATDNPVAKTQAVVEYDNKPVLEVIPIIPSSTIKGVLRSLLEQYLVEGCRSGPKTTLKEYVERYLEALDGARGEMLFELKDKLVNRVLEQYIDSQLLRGLEGSLGGDAEKYLKIVTGVSGESVSDDYRHVVEITRKVAGTFTIYRDVCNPVIEGLNCELPIPEYKLHALKSVFGSGQDPIRYPCTACRLFGLPGYFSKTIVYDALPVGVKDIVVSSRTHIAIDRVTDTVVQGKTFDIEYILPGARFVFLVRYDLSLSNIDSLGAARCIEAIEKAEQNAKSTLDKENLKTLKELVEYIESIGKIQIGKRKTWGYGEVEIKCLEAHIKNITKTHNHQNSNPSKNPSSNQQEQKEQKAERGNSNDSSGGEAEVKSELKKLLEENKSKGVPKTLNELLKIYGITRNEA